MSVLAAQPVYTEAERTADRALCQHYFRGWLQQLGRTKYPVVYGVTFPDFQTAADRLAEAPKDQ